ncbi:hypothetical protein BIWAKO_06479 [Bosea sp. BIWAKO-01]|nr:hypothetical protein BIWAKO_06479 [Bosea sp. BIWAKO-01]
MGLAILHARHSPTGEGRLQPCASPIPCKAAPRRNRRQPGHGWQTDALPFGRGTHVGGCGQAPLCR